MSTGDLLLTVEILDEQGNAIEERNVTTYRKLLDAAHAKKLSAIATEIVSATDQRIIAKATITLDNGTFTGIGDASRENVPEKLVHALPRVAETRAVCRALRAALNVGYVAVEEIADPVRFLRGSAEPNNAANAHDDRASERMSTAPPERAPTPPVRPDRGRFPQRSRGRDDRPTEAAQGDERAMSDAQRKLLFRLAFSEGHQGDAARNRVLEVLGVQRLEHATRLDASRAIDALQRAAGNRPTNGASHGP